jgi:hypothetical protein
MHWAYADLLAFPASQVDVLYEFVGEVLKAGRESEPSLDMDALLARRDKPEDEGPVYEDHAVYGED